MLKWALVFEERDADAVSGDHVPARKQFRGVNSGHRVHILFTQVLWKGCRPARTAVHESGVKFALLAGVRVEAECARQVAMFTLISCVPCICCFLKNARLCHQVWLLKMAPRRMFASPDKAALGVDFPGNGSNKTSDVAVAVLDVKSAPTRFGGVSYTLTSQEGLGPTLQFLIKCV